MSSLPELPEESGSSLSAFRLRAVAGMGGFAAATTVGWWVHPGGLPLLAVACALVGLVTLVAAFAPRCTLATLVMLVLVAAGFVRGDLAHQGHPLVPTAATLVLSGTVSSTESPGVVVDIDHITDGLGTHASGGRALLTGRSLGTFVVGDVVEVTASALKAPGHRPGARSMEALDRDGVDVIATVTSASVVGVSEGPPRWLALTRTRLKAAVDAVLPEPASSLVLGVALGVHQTIDSATHDTLQNAGLYHIVAVSGLKVIIVIGLLESAARLLRWPPRRRRALGLCGIALYVLISGAGAAALRSSLMATLAFVVTRDGRRLDPFAGLAFIAALLCGIEPAIAFDVGFQLSFAGTAGILLLATPLRRFVPLPAVIAEPLCVTVAAQLATAPIIAGTFNVVSIIGPIANALVLPLLPVMIAVGVVGAVLSAWIPALGWLPLHAAAILCDATVAVSSLLTALPGAFFLVGRWPAGWTVAEVAGLLAGFSVAIVLTRRRVRLAAEWRVIVAGLAGAAVAMVSVLIAAIPDGVTRVTVLDVGAAPAVLITLPDGTRALVDTGSSAATLDTALGRVLPPLDTTIGLLVIGAGDPHATGGITGLPGHYSVERAVVPVSVPVAAGTALAALEATGTQIITGTVSWVWHGISWRCLGFDPDAAASGCVLALNGPGGWSTLLAGLAPPATQDEVAASTGRADLVIAPPGGALAQSLLDATRPSLVADPTTPGGRHLDPGGGVAMALTGSDGDLTFSATGSLFTRD